MKNYALWAGLCLLAMTSSCKKDELEPEAENPNVEVLETSNTGENNPPPTNWDWDKHRRTKP